MLKHTSTHLNACTELTRPQARRTALLKEAWYCLQVHTVYRRVLFTNASTHSLHASTLQKTFHTAADVSHCSRLFTLQQTFATALTRARGRHAEYRHPFRVSRLLGFL
eukprot:353643-Chlamydomonas_euryale.AAC.10